MTNQQTATHETLVDTLWACRQFIVNHIHSGEEWPIILRIDKELARDGMTEQKRERLAFQTSLFTVRGMEIPQSLVDLILSEPDDNGPINLCSAGMVQNRGINGYWGPR